MTLYDHAIRSGLKWAAATGDRGPLDEAVRHLADAYAKAGAR